MHIFIYLKGDVHSPIKQDEKQVHTSTRKETLFSFEYQHTISLKYKSITLIEEPKFTHIYQNKNYRTLEKMKFI
jgi:hypothetical protein